MELPSWLTALRDIGLAFGVVGFLYWLYAVHTHLAAEDPQETPDQP